jgi:hypothetical protein
VLGNHIRIDFHWLNIHDVSYRSLQGHGVVSTNRLEEGVAELGWRLQEICMFGLVLLPTKESKPGHSGLKGRRRGIDGPGAHDHRAGAGVGVRVRQIIFTQGLPMSGHQPDGW